MSLAELRQRGPHVAGRRQLMLAAALEAGGSRVEFSLAWFRDVRQDSAGPCIGASSWNEQYSRTLVIYFFA
jgi:hypothetical protein